MSNPSLQGFGFRPVAGEDETVQASLVDTPLFQVSSPATTQANASLTLVGS
jgi:hypothetical protein